MLTSFVLKFIIRKHCVDNKFSTRQYVGSVNKEVQTVMMHVLRYIYFSPSTHRWSSRSTSTMGQLYSPPFRGPPLPREITDMVIDFLHYDVQSLLACALVSSSWLRSSRLHLFHTCAIRPKQLDVAFDTIITNTDVGTYFRQLTIYHCFLFKSELKTLLCCLPRLRRLTLHEVK